jgi:riboflavin synthase
MFTGIVEETGRVERVKPSAASIALTVEMKGCGRGLKVGDSLAVNGCCLTVAQIRSRRASKLARFDLLRETWQRTNLQFVSPGALVNLERALRANSRLGGHFVSGHIDGVGIVRCTDRAGADVLMEIDAPADILRYVVLKGCIAVDGVSLTVAGLRKKSLSVWLIPHTLAVTALRERKPGGAVNLEADLLGKYVERFVTAARRK